MQLFNLKLYQRYLVIEKIRNHSIEYILNLNTSGSVILSYQK
jgi:hypothetical protein